MIRKSLILQIGRNDIIDTPVKESVVYFSYFDSPEQLYFMNDKAEIKKVISKFTQEVVVPVKEKEVKKIIKPILPVRSIKHTVVSVESLIAQKRIYKENAAKMKEEIDKVEIIRKEMLLLKIHNKTRELEILRTKKDLKEIKENLNPVKNKKESKLKKFFSFKK